MPFLVNMCVIVSVGWLFILSQDSSVQKTKTLYSINSKKAESLVFYVNPDVKLDSTSNVSMNTGLCVFETEHMIRTQSGLCMKCDRG